MNSNAKSTYSNKGLTKGQKPGFINANAILASNTSEPLDETDMTPDYYGAKCKCGLKMDPYAICDAYDNIKASAHHHAIKKLLRAGESHKPLVQDITEVIASLDRWKQQLETEL